MRLHTHQWRGVWQTVFHLACHVAFIPLIEAGCAPHPISVRIGNVTLPNQSNARGIGMAVGSPEQPFAFLPQWPLNNTMIYGTSGFCELWTTPWTEQGCMTFRGGEYDSFASQTRTQAATNAYPADSRPYPAMNFVADTLKVNENVSLVGFPLGIALNNWGEQGYHPQMAVGMGPNSTFLSALQRSGKIATRVWGMFWGRQGANSNAQLVGSMVFGGYDKAKVTGQPFTQTLSSDRSSCATGMLVTITDLVLNFPNGTNASLFPSARSTSISACIVPDYPVLMTMPFNPFFSNFINHTNATFGGGRSFGLNFFSVRYDDSKDTPYRGDLTVKLQSGLAVRIPNDQLVIPDTYSDPQTGRWVVNATDPTLIINSIQDVNANDLTQLGRQFLSAAYLMVDEERSQFSLWVANPTAREDLVALDSEGGEADSPCPAPSVSPGDHGPVASSNGVSPGAIAGITVGVLAVGAVAAVWAVWRRRQKQGALQVERGLGHETAAPSAAPLYEGNPKHHERWELGAGDAGGSSHSASPPVDLEVQAQGQGQIHAAHVLHELPVAYSYPKS
ncbi:aspartic peptidase domain-containing protein [Podospora appendiculata]|uniref:Aspartic peptidase domain-containing protein n=1 Tax=Podospora appendiculata TaxID=314037 RepID=A0AAE0X6Y2_9PEZI|nr:aspartic peptidase domain-containing protein [Podospora appendiculata]